MLLLLLYAFLYENLNFEIAPISLENQKNHPQNCLVVHFSSSICGYFVRIQYLNIHSNEMQPLP